VHILSEIMHELTCGMHLRLATVLPTLSGAWSHLKVLPSCITERHSMLRYRSQTQSKMMMMMRRGGIWMMKQASMKKMRRDVPTAKPEADPKAEDTMDLEEGGDEIDPLDAFMADNDAKVAPIKAEEQAAVQGNMHTCCTTAGNPLDASVHTCHVHANHVVYFCTCCA